jgi:RNA polymerase sigma factor (sigma-70 family)
MMAKSIPALLVQHAPEVPPHDASALLDETFRAHAPAIRGWLIGLTRDPAVAEDLLSESFLRLATEIAAGRPPQDPAAWLHRVGRNLAISRARHGAVVTRMMPALLERGVAESPEDTVIDRERDEQLSKALDSLRGDDRRIVVLAALGYKPEEIAHMTGVSGPVLRTRLCRARGRLRSHPALAALYA